MSRKLRTFEEVVGHKAQINFLTKHVADDNVADVIIFAGNPGIGKSSIAKILACEVACRYESPELLEQYRTAVIDNNQSTDSIRLYNMSTIQEKEEEIQKVTADMTVGFSKTKRKILILDEAHNISKKAQDAILIGLEHLPKGVYVFICTTELGALRPALQSRSKATFNLNGLSDIEAATVLRKCIDAKKFTFDISKDLVISFVRDWANNEPRKMCNLFDNFAPGSVIKSRDLEVFINVTNASVIIELMKYLYGSMVLGIEFLEGVKYDDSFVSMLIEVCKIVMGHTSKNVSSKELIYIKSFMNDKDPIHFIRFTAGVAGLGDLRKRKIISIFMKSHPQYKDNTVPVKGVSQEAKSRDLRELSENVENSFINLGLKGREIAVPSLDDLFDNGDNIAFEPEIDMNTPTSIGSTAFDIVQGVKNSL